MPYNQATNYGIKGSWDDAVFLEVLPGVAVPAFVPKDGVKIPEKDEEKKVRSVLR